MFSQKVDGNAEVSKLMEIDLTLVNKYTTAPIFLGNDKFKCHIFAQVNVNDKRLLNCRLFELFEQNWTTCLRSICTYDINIFMDFCTNVIGDLFLLL